MQGSESHPWSSELLICLLESFKEFFLFKQKDFYLLTSHYKHPDTYFEKIFDIIEILYSDIFVVVVKFLGTYSI